MSRIGTLPIQIPEKVDVSLKKGNVLTVKGPKGELTRTFSDQVKITIDEGTVTLERKGDDNFSKSVHGLTRALIANMVEGVSNGFTKKLEINGVGFKAEMKGKKLVLNVGYSHPIVLGVTDDIQLSAPTQTTIEVTGIDKELVGLVAAKIRSFRKPEPYKGKGIRYEGEYIRRKAGKAAGK